MSNEEELIKQFVDVTGVSEERAKFYVESSNSNLELALASFFEGGPDQNLDEDQMSGLNERSASAGGGGGDNSSDDLEMELPKLDAALSSSSTSYVSKKAPKKKSTSNVATLFTMNKSSSDEDEEEGQAFYAGGSERSGQQVLGPPRRKTPSNDIVSEVFRSAQESGAEIIEHRHAPSSSGGSSSLFTGMGYRLGMTAEDHEALPQTSRPRPQTIEPVVLKLWRQGFSINNGELRLYEDPVNKEFLNSIMKGEIPNELRQMVGSGTVDFELEDHRHEEFKKTPGKIQAFAGKGHTLGSPAPNVVADASVGGTTTGATPKKTESSTEDAEKQANDELAVDQSQPTTMIQVRLADGSRLSGRFNHTHTVDDIRRFVITARPQYTSQSFMLLTTFPSKELSDGTLTISSAGLLGAAIMQRLK